MTPEIHARYFDGKSAAAHAATLVWGDDGLHIRAAEASVHWPRDGIRRLDDRRDAGVLRLGVESSPDERLLLDGVDVVRLVAVAPELADDRPARRAELRLIVGLIAGAAAAGAAIFFGIPMAAKPLAALTPLAMERNIGDAVYAQARLTFRRCDGTQELRARQLLNRLADQLERHADSPFDVHVQMVDSFMPNAFALPGGRVLITDELVAMAQSPDEIAGVIAHEIAHVEQRHVMQLIWRDMGFGLLLDALVGGSGVVQQAYLASGQVFQLRYGRAAEAQADARAVDMMQAAGFNPGAMGHLFQRLAEATGESDLEDGQRAGLEFLSTHPDIVARADRLRALDAPASGPALSDADWSVVKHFGCMNDLTDPAGPFGGL
jgi:Zn-dependent protease with chaperone function